MSGKRSRATRGRQPDALSNAGVYLLFLGAIAFILPTFFHESLLITSWLGSMQAPVGLSAMVVGGALLVAGLARRGLRRTGIESGGTTSVDLPTNVTPPPPGPMAAAMAASMPPNAPPGPGAVAVPTQPGAGQTSLTYPAPGATPLSAAIDAAPPPLEPLYRPPTSLDDLGPSGPT